jgi:glucoamylase
MRGYFLKNINIDGKGGVAAAPSYAQTPAGSYYYHWMRDGSLSMKSFQDTNPSNFSSIESTIKTYIQWELGLQNEADPNGIDVRIEPKFQLSNGQPYTDGWCRPQNDGPGLRATTMMLAARQLIDAGQMNYVKSYLWTNDPNVYHGGAIKYDLDYLLSGYSSSTCDLWEETWDTNFFWNRITMKKALLLGAKFATEMGDSASASKYSNMAATINADLRSSHWNGVYIQEASGLVQSTVKAQDAAVIIGLNDGFEESDALFAPTSLEVAQTVAFTSSVFCGEYAINTADTANGVPGILYGRYKGDVYAGGNPWQLITAALASLFYRGANYILTHGVPSNEALNVWKSAFNVDSLPSDAIGLARVFAAQGDGVLLRLRHHVAGDNFHLYEQIDRNTGVQKSAADLTWSVSSFLCISFVLALIFSYF